jgi:xanthine/CO dehydrogenase XdhC/CoxF family maturation factor
MNNSIDEKIFEEAIDWLNNYKKIALVTVIQTWGSSPRQVGSKMIVNEKGDFSGSVSGGCVESFVIGECIELLKKNKPNKRLDFKVTNEIAWDIGLACGGNITVYLQQIKK